MKKINLKMVVVSMVLTGCAHSTTVGGLTVDSVTGAFDPSVTLATARDTEGKIILQQIISGPGAGQILYNGAAQIGASAVFGIGAAPLVRPSRQSTNISTNNSVEQGQVQDQGQGQDQGQESFNGE